MLTSPTVRLAVRIGMAGLLALVAGCGGAGSQAIIELLKPLVLSLVGGERVLGLYDSKSNTIVQAASFAGIVLDIAERDGAFYVLVHREAGNELFRVPSPQEEPVLVATLPTDAPKIAVSPEGSSFAFPELNEGSYRLSIQRDGLVEPYPQALDVLPTTLQWSQLRGVLFLREEGGVGTSLRALDPLSGTVETLFENIHIIDFDYDDSTDTVVLHTLVEGEQPRSVFIELNLATGATMATVEQPVFGGWAGMAYDGKTHTLYFRRGEELMLMDLVSAAVSPAPVSVPGDLLYVARTEL